MANFTHMGFGATYLEQLATRSSPVHRLHPAVKLIVTMVYILVVLSFPSWYISGLAAYLFYPVVMMALSNTPYRPLLKRLLIALPFPVFGGLSNVFFLRGTALVIGRFPVSFGLLAFASVLIKTMLCVSAVLILIATTSLAEISQALSAMGLPNVLCLQLVMTTRYLSVLLAEAEAMLTAYVLRSGRKAIRLKDMGSFLGQLLLRSFDRAERVYQAMKCRGFRGVYNGKRRAGLRPGDWLWLLLLPLAMTALRFFNLSLFLGRLVGGN